MGEGAYKKGKLSFISTGRCLQTLKEFLEYWNKNLYVNSGKWEKKQDPMREITSLVILKTPLRSSGFMVRTVFFFVFLVSFGASFLLQFQSSF